MGHICRELRLGVRAVGIGEVTAIRRSLQESCGLLGEGVFGQEEVDSQRNAAWLRRETWPQANGRTPVLEGGRVLLE